jgi:predicted SprT family Zn-dependent metalloprotease
VYINYDYALSLAKDQVHDTFLKAKCSHLIDLVSIRWNSRFTSTAGIYRSQKKLIEFSKQLWPHLDDSGRRDTAIHEACHAIVSSLYSGRQGHGHNWKMMMVKCGGIPKSTFKLPAGFDTGRRRKKRVRFQCGCIDGCPAGPTVAKRILAGTHTYRCQRCGQVIKKVLTLGNVKVE